MAGSATNPVTLDRYLYAGGNPETLIDPDGHTMLGSPTGNCGPDNYLCAPPDKAAKKQVAAYKARVEAEHQQTRAQEKAAAAYDCAHYGVCGGQTATVQAAPQGTRDQGWETLDADQIWSADKAEMSCTVHGCAEANPSLNWTPIVVGTGVTAILLACVAGVCVALGVTAAADAATDAAVSAISALGYQSVGGLVTAGVGGGLSDVGGTALMNLLTGKDLTEGLTPASIAAGTVASVLTFGASAAAPLLTRIGLGATGSLVAGGMASNIDHPMRPLDLVQRGADAFFGAIAGAPQFADNSTGNVENGVWDALWTGIEHALVP